MIQLVKLVQSDKFTLEIKAIKIHKNIPSNSKLLKLTPFLDESGILRVGGRLKRSGYDFPKKHPILLPKDHILSKLIILDQHNQLMHAGPQLTLYTLRERYWILDARKLVRKIIHNCIVCFKYPCVPLQPLMVELPPERVTPSRPFYNTGVDYAGPFMIRDRFTKPYKTIKAYICLFICMATKAVHLELVGDLTTHSFLSALRRFSSRRGKPSVIFSDNGTNFVSAYKELGLFLKQESKTIHINLSLEGISWKFIPAKAPHFGGLWERGIRSVKFHLKRVVGTNVLSYEQFLTVLVQIEGILNSRPLHPLSSDPNDTTPLSPSHFLIGEAITSIPEPNYLNTPTNRLKQFQLTQAITQDFWSRWSRDYISQLQAREKWKNNSPNLLQPGTLVIVKEDDLPPQKCSLVLMALFELLP
ncbi:uncharacterized protein [Diabrotica undecimpunctata]|uniref:uncharacterized protein n=1 Tax=Diabrotica undecimpunctata TaxID=50387 RepID=UPI003B63C326